MKRLRGLIVPIAGATLLFVFLLALGLPLFNAALLVVLWGVTCARSGGSDEGTASVHAPSGPGPVPESPESGTTNRVRGYF